MYYPVNVVCPLASEAACLGLSRVCAYYVNDNCNKFVAAARTAK